MLGCGFIRRTRTRNAAGDLLRHVKHVRRVREDIAPRQALAALAEQEDEVHRSLASGDTTAIENAMRGLESAVMEVMPPPRHQTVTEYVEILAVALSVAMACRAYFIQPFKIPTGSMQPTLYGIHFLPVAKPETFDRYPWKPLRWLATGQWYREVRSVSPGVVRIRARPGEGIVEQPVKDNVFTVPCTVSIEATATYDIPSGMSAHIVDGQRVSTGDLLASGREVAGDHVFVDKVAWNFRRPRRSEVMVFMTSGIPTLRPNEHYIKRMVGLPGESISIRQPLVLVRGVPIEDGFIAQICHRAPGYENGYVNVGGLSRPDMELRLGPGEYMALGDNSTRSADSRYWGPVPERNLVGPAWVVYWPWSERWGRVKE